ncbi:MAG: hypothetical protein AB2707_16865, partial [Candidatus Thiodiazotropha sp.]
HGFIPLSLALSREGRVAHGSNVGANKRFESTTWQEASHALELRFPSLLMGKGEQITRERSELIHSKFKIHNSKLNTKHPKTAIYYGSFGCDIGRLEN